VTTGQNESISIRGERMKTVRVRFLPFAPLHFFFGLTPTTMKFMIPLFLFYFSSVAAKQLSLEELEKKVFKTNFKSVLAVFFSGDLRKIQEFVAFHFIQGFQRIHIYNDGHRGIELSSFGKLAKFIEITQMPKTSKGRIYRQICAFRDAFSNRNNSNMVIGLIDVDEYVWSNDYPNRLVPEVVKESGLDEALLYCPRFGLVNMKPWNASQLIISQFTARSLFHEAWNRTGYPDCKINSTEPQGICFESTYRKTIYSMLNLPYSATNHVSIHGIHRKQFHNFSSWISTTKRTAGSGGLSCNHYFALDDIAKKVKLHEDFNNSQSIPTFYDVFAKSKQVQQYYVMYKDSIARDASLLN